MAPARTRNSRATALFLAAALLAAVAGGAAEKLELPEGFSLWQESLSVRAGFGYNDNVTLSSFAPTGSAFAQVGGDFMLYRLPWNNWQFSFFANGSDARFLNEDTGVKTDQQAMASAQLTWFLGKGWKSISTAQYLYLNQVMDVSADYNVPTRQEVIAHGITGTQGLRKDLGPYWVEADVSVSRYFVHEPLDDYWQGGPELKLGRGYGHGSEVSVTYQAAPISYDSREQADTDGTPVPGTRLQFMQQTAGIAWQHYWDENRRWRSLTRFSYNFSEDNGSGYYNYSQYLASEQLRFRSANWEFSVQVALAYYDFPNQPAMTSGPPPRHRTDLRLTLRGERALSRHWKIYAEYDYERSYSDDPLDQYEANVASAGVEFAF